MIYDFFMVFLKWVLQWTTTWDYNELYVTIIVTIWDYNGLSWNTIPLSEWVLPPSYMEYPYLWDYNGLYGL